MNKMKDLLEDVFYGKKYLDPFTIVVMLSVWCDKFLTVLLSLPKPIKESLCSMSCARHSLILILG